MRGIWFSLAVASFALPASAHDFWLQPSNFWPAPNTTVPTAFMVGHGPDRQVWGAPLDRVVMVRTVGPNRTIDRKPDLLAGRAGGDLTLRFVDPGAQVLLLETARAESDLPALRFNDYAKVEGLTAALAVRDRTGRSNMPGRELYSRRAKVLVQVGAPDPKRDAHVTQAVGLSLEIVPEKNPYTLADNERLPVRVMYEGKPLAGALVKLTNLDFDGRPLESHLSDAAGRTSFNVPRVGPWLVNVIWTKPIQGNPKADFDTTFSSLTFGYPRRRPG